MKKVLSLFILMAAFCVVGFAQSAPKVAKKAMLLPNNAQVVNPITKQVRIAKGTVPTPTPNGKIKTVKNTTNTPIKSKKQSSNLPLKQLPNNIKLIKRLGQQ